jgi:2-phosphoglycerate kinase
MRRSRERSGRKASRYLERIDDIWELQSYLLSEADNGGIPIITNRQVESTVREVMKLIMAKVMKRYPPVPSGLDRDVPPTGTADRLP